MTLAHKTSPFGERTQKYWDQRYSLFSKWDEGILTDEEGLFSVKPEAFAIEIAQLLRGHIVLDAFCGIGGSAIAFARCGKRVVAVDTDGIRLSMAKHNAAIYGVADNIEFLQGDVTILYDNLYDNLSFDALNLDPPWGGPEYSKKSTFGWSDFSPNPLPLIKKAINAHINIAVGLPSNFSQSSLLELPGNIYIKEAHDKTRVLFKTMYFPPPILYDTIKEGQ